MSKRRVRDPQREAFWKKTILDQRSSNESIRAYCQRLRISEAAYYYWQRELKRRETEALPAFVAITVVPTASDSTKPSPTMIEVRCPSGHVVVINGVEDSTFRALFSALSAQEASC
ncbi:hypothetical protein KIH39_08110 [Telmatocola sphagniphila]|uniref:Transposase n=1 Tax=Telmatocola sphagniphila TaxID=1123043 RepID=A0A8E6B8S9_9BACT|nr:hypothetical protein [Telmatocola sphagniphila]QVL33856.1 hypothetical protein KIH39_08110 [Telmatocola sphagniphila]